MEELIKNHHWKQKEVINEKSAKLPNIRKQYLFSMFAVVLLLIVIYIILLFTVEGNGIYALVFVGNLLAFFFGGIIVTLLMIFYNNIMINKSRKEIAKYYSKLINSDIERIYKTFKNKKFSFARIGELSILGDWVMILSNISLELSQKELDTFVSFYKQLDYIESIKSEFNSHIKALEGISFKEYSRMKEYNNSIALLSKEFKKLFSIEVDELIDKLKKISSY